MDIALLAAAHAEAVTIGRDLYHRRRAVGLTQIELGDILGVSGFTISARERGRKSMGVAEFIAHAAALGAHITLEDTDA
jgi:transcriptional regulator with XRE-family HTH domain